MVEKLEFRHIMPYLTHKLICQSGYFGNTIISEILGINIDNEYQIHLNECNTKIQGVKPLLINLNNINDKQWTEIFRVGFINVGHEVWPIGESFIERHANAIEIVYAGKSATYDFVNKQFETGIFAFNQKVAFEKIYEYHGDIDFLIEAGLALDKLDY